VEGHSASLAPWHRFGNFSLTRPALAILYKETCDAMGLLGVNRMNELGEDLLASSKRLILPPHDHFAALDKQG